MVGDNCGAAAHLCPKPVDGEGGDIVLGECLADSPSLYEAEGVPDFVAEISSLFAEGFVEENVVAGRR